MSSRDGQGISHPHAPVAGSTAVGLGEVMLRLSPAIGHRIETASSLDVHVAGAEGNVLAALARLGVRSSLVTAFPDAPAGRRAAAELLAAGVDLTYARRIADSRIGTFYVERGVGARATSVWYDRARSAFAEHVAWIPGALLGARMAVLSGITPALSAAARRAAAGMADEADERGVPLCFDVNYRPRLWPPEAARAELSPLLARAKIAVCSAHDAQAVFDADPDDVPAFRERWAPRAEVCVITRGKRGAIATGDGGRPIVTEAFATTVVDRLGIGDAFVAGLLHGLLAERPLAVALEEGAALAALKATVAGDLSVASAEDLEAVVARQASIGVTR